MASFDVMPEVQLFQPVELDDALKLADELGGDGWLLGGGQAVSYTHLTLPTTP